MLLYVLIQISESLPLLRIFLGLISISLNSRKVFTVIILSLNDPPDKLLLFLKICKNHLEYRKDQVIYLLVVGLVYLHCYLIYCLFWNSLLQAFQRIKFEIDIVSQNSCYEYYIFNKFKY